MSLLEFGSGLGLVIGLFGMFVNRGGRGNERDFGLSVITFLLSTVALIYALKPWDWC